MKNSTAKAKQQSSRTSTQHPKPPSDSEDVTEVSNSAPKPPTTGKVYWDKDSTCTDCILDWLDQNISHTQKLFSDSSQDAREENHSRHVAKGSKTHYYALIADALFSVDKKPEARADFSANPDKYTKAVENHIGK